MELNFLKKVNNVSYLNQERGGFSSLYLKVRAHENRILTDNQLSQLPYVSPDNSLFKEWSLRQKSAVRFINYLKKKNKPLKILDLGCGNGWFTHKMAKITPRNYVLGMDINISELEQAAKVFANDNLHFVYGDIFALKDHFESSFDVITVNAAIQYFRELSELILLLKSFLTNSGELHIIDSPFYEPKAVSEARERTRNYYSKLGFPKMAEYYHHHSKEDVSEFELLYFPKKSLINRLRGVTDSPFPWLKYTNEN